jgi:hypothetical protein
MSSPIQRIPAQDPLPDLGDSSTAAVAVLLVMAGLFVLYLLVDYLRSRKTMRKMEARRRMARELWEQDQSRNSGQ